MSRERAEAAARPLVAVAFVTLLAGLSWQLGVALHPIIGWALPTLVVGVLGWRLLERWQDRREVVAVADAHASRHEPLALPESYRPPERSGPPAPLR